MPFQLTRSSNLKFWTNSRKEGIRIPNDKHFSELVTKIKGLYLRHNIYCSLNVNPLFKNKF